MHDHSDHDLCQVLLTTAGYERDRWRLQSLLAMFSDSPYLLLFVVMIVPFVLCMLIDQIALLLIIVPLYKSLIDLMPVEPLVFWFLLLVNITVGGITPPFGYTLFALKGATTLVSMQDIYRSVLPFVMIYFFFCICSC